MDKAKKQFNVYGMSCAACAKRVEDAVSKTEGVVSVTVSLLTNEMSVEFLPPANESSIIDSVKKAGYNAVIAKNNIKKPARISDAETRKSIKRLIPSALLLIVLMYFSMGKMLGIKQFDFLLNDGGAFVSSVIQLFLSLAILIINGRFFVSGIKSLFRLSPNMDALVTIGSGVSFIYSAVIAANIAALTINGDYSSAHELCHSLYFEGAAMIVTLITLGKTLESFSKGKTTNAINALMTLAPDTATVMKNGKEIVIPVEDVKKGDIIVVRTGGYVPVDARIVSGSAWMDQSTMTGESVPVEKSFGDDVFCGTVNVNGYFTAEATNVGEDTSLGKIINIVKNVNLSKAPIAKIADKVSGVFVPAVIGIAIITFFVWLISGAELSFCIQRAVAVILISCPCALGLATPVAIMVGSGVGAKHGALFKSATALENLGKINAIVFDKTGTLTFGKPEVTDVVTVKGRKINDLKRIAASLEKLSEHPIASAVVSAYNGIVDPVTDYKTLSGLGLSGIINGKTIFGGNAKLMKDNGIDISELEGSFKTLSEQGKTVVFFAEGDLLLGLIAVSDKEKPFAAQVVEQTKKLGVTPYLLTGDNKTVAFAVAEKLGIDRSNVYAEVLPDEKAKIVSLLKETGKVAMVGDGVNDAPSLSVADVGITLENGSFVATEAAEVMVLGDISNIVTAIKLSKNVILNVKENLFWAFFYNVICIPLAAGAFYSLLGWTLSPMIAAGAMSLSSLFVVSNALRLNLFKPFKPDAESGVCPVYQTVENNEKNKENRKMQEKIYTVNGMMCAHCEARVKKAVESIEGVISCTPDHNNNTAVVKTEGNVDDASIISAIEAEGYTVG